jgi:glutathione S-transferase
MTYELVLGDRTYSSWSLRGWLLFARFNLPVSTKMVRMYTPEFQNTLDEYAPARLVPAAHINGATVYETLAIAETLNELHPEAAMWPADPAARGMARSITSEMHAGFSHLRTDCVMNLRRHYPDFAPSEAVLADIKRIEVLWRAARDATPQATEGPWLFGDYSIADVFFAPVATRIATYNLPVGPAAQAYVNTHLSAPHFRRWRAMGLAQNYVQPGYDLDLPSGDWPGPKPVTARAVDHGPSINDLCPYSNKPVTHFMELDSTIYGFCNAFCRDKTVADPDAWEFRDY